MIYIRRRLHAITHLTREPEVRRQLRHEILGDETAQQSEETESSAEADKGDVTSSQDASSDNAEIESTQRSPRSPRSPRALLEFAGKAVEEQIEKKTIMERVNEQREEEVLALLVVNHEY